MKYRIGYKGSKNKICEKIIDIMPLDRFECVEEFTHRSTLCATANLEVKEKIFMPKKQAKSFIKNGWLF